MQPDPFMHIQLHEQEIARTLANRALEHEALAAQAQPRPGEREEGIAAGRRSVLGSIALAASLVTAAAAALLSRATHGGRTAI
jgi:hypothetical protein